MNAIHPCQGPLHTLLSECITLLLKNVQNVDIGESMTEGLKFELMEVRFFSPKVYNKLRRTNVPNALLPRFTFLCA